MSNLTKKLTGTEHLISSDPNLSAATALDFWKWAYSDIQMNAIRGVFAEWLIARILGIDDFVRDQWAGWDLTYRGVKIEVKSGSYIQSWTKCPVRSGSGLSDPSSCTAKQSRINFGGLRSQLWIDDINDYSQTANYNADFYVFCTHTATCCQNWNAFDLGQWRFYVLSKEKLDIHKYKSVSLSYVLRAGAVPLEAESLQAHLDMLIEQSQKVSS